MVPKMILRLGFVDFFGGTRYWTKGCMDLVTSACDDVTEARQQRKHNCTRSERHLIRSIADGLEAY